MNRTEKSEINKAAYSVGVLLPDLIRKQAILLKQLDKPMNITINLQWNDQSKQFDFVHPDQDKF